MSSATPGSTGSPRRSALGTAYRRVRRVVLARRRLLAAALAALAVLATVRATAQPVTRVPVVVAAHDLPAGAVLGPADLAVRGFAPGSVPSGTLGRDAAVGRTTVAPMRAGEPLTDVRLLTDSLLAGYPGRVAAPVRITDSGAVALLRVGDRIDVLAADPQGEQPVRTVADAAPVVAIPEEAGHPGADLVPGALVVLAVSEDTAGRLAEAGVDSSLAVVIDR